ncbi:carboxymuconolactone decarboxylase family protein [Micromonospora sp. DR5-3]|uniref:carboxymuconolactone decarboxylase family protein n=1 Tax=unclassified Micromonospora TaxID=2617518 RepID=UPI0021046127|nr:MULTISPECIES: carboxymuconolactone decarboxylase family protein [unclassified Micromonospora]MCW3818278.1 carboxymuconolactone decarboxylase family protein [Micromonospora sp. DR5-3]
MIVSRVAASVVQRQVRHVTPVPALSASGLVDRVYQQVADEMRLVIPPALMHSPSPRALAAYWMLMREPLLVSGTVDRASKEAAAAAVAVATICPYCVDMHSVSMYEMAGEYDADKLAADRAGDMRDPRLREISQWARGAQESPGGLPLPIWLNPEQGAELVGTVTAMHYLTRMVNVFLSSFLLPPGLTGRARQRMKQGLGRLLRETLRAHREPGRSLELLPDAPVPADAAWAASSPSIAGAMARAAAVFDAAGERWLTPAVRAVVHEHLDNWRGADTGISTAWCEDLLAGLGPADRAAGRLALLTAVSSHQVGDEVVAEFRRHMPGDEVLVEVAGWASFEAARRIGARQRIAAHGAHQETRRPGIA